MTFRTSFRGLAVLIVPSMAFADVTEINLLEMPLNETPIEGVLSAPVSGAMDADGVFGATAEMTEGSLFPPHSHPDARMSLVLEGTMYLGVGDTVDQSVEQIFEAGAIALTPAGVSHWMAAREGDVRILEIGTGPTTTDWTE